VGQHARFYSLTFVCNEDKTRFPSSIRDHESGTFLYPIQGHIQQNSHVSLRGTWIIARKTYVLW